MCYQSMVQNVTCRFSDEVKKAYSCVLDYFNFNHAWYCKITNNGHFSSMDTNPEWAQYLAGIKFYRNYDYFRHPKYFSSGFTWQNNPRNKELDKILKKGKKQYDYQFYLRLHNKTSDGVECFGFTSDYYAENQVSLLLNELQYLRLFTQKFRENNQFLFSRFENNQIDLAKLVGPTFYEKPHLVLPRMPRKPFLQGIGTSIESISIGELDVIKLLIQGHSASQIGEKLFRSKRTIEHRLEKIKEKLGCFSKSELIRKAREMEQVGLL